MGQIAHPYDYAVTHRQALQVNWQLKDIIGGEKRLDFRTPFCLMPGSTRARCTFSPRPNA